MKHQNIIAKMTLEEKAAFLSGKTVWETRDFERLHLSSIFLSDGPHGIRKQAGAGDHLGLNESLPATCFPTAASIANSWDEQLGEEIGSALGQEAAAQDVNILLGPGLNIKRSPLCGRNFEYFSEDPYLSGKMAASYIRGIQSQDVYACPKHFAVNSQEFRRMAMNSVLDERTLREIYLTGFEIAVKEGKAKSIMTSYNEVNGTYANENKHLLSDILRKEWGFDGIVVTDWGASNDHAAGVAAGSNLEMPAPGLDSARELLKAVEEKRLTDTEIDVCVDELLDAVITLTQNNKQKKIPFSENEHHELARRAAEESAVLLKNEGSLLPLRSGCKVAFIGDFAVTPRYQGAGSSMVNPTYLETLEHILGQYEIQVVGISKGFQRNGEMDSVLQKESLELAAKAEVIIYCFGLNELSESEGMDRTHMRIPQNQIDLLESLTQINKNIVGLLSAGSAVEMPWEPNLKALLHGFLNGQAGASAMLNLLTGKTNPSGKLAETYPVKYEDTPAYHYFSGERRNVEYRESIYVGYRYYDTCHIPVLYPFGYGLSYTDFDYLDLNVSDNGISFKIINIGKMDGMETAQFYVMKQDSNIFRPEKELKGFKKVFLKCGEIRKVTISFDEKTFRYWNVNTGQWETEGGTWQILVGASSADIRLQASIEIKGTNTDSPYKKEDLPSYYSGQISNVEEKEFEKLLGYAAPENKPGRELQINDPLCQMRYARSLIARLVYRILTKRKEKSEASGKPDLNILFIYNMPFRAIAKMSNGIVSMKMVYGIIDVVNRHFFRGIKQIIGGFVSNYRANKRYEAKLSGK